MIAYTWRIASACVVGSAHGRTETPCQDAASHSVIEDSGGALILVVSDGAGSATMGGEGARLACEHFVTCISSSLKKGMGVQDLSSATANEWLTDFRQLIDQEAKAH